jgi:D-sedoheptulose 7-phosphate isomerase
VNTEDKIKHYCANTSENFKKLEKLSGVIAKASERILEKLQNGGKVMFCGNGGSAADAQHLAAELMGRYKLDRPPLPALALTVDTSAITAIANDYDYTVVFKRQIEGIGREGDVLIGISTSGQSPNVLSAITSSKSHGIFTIGLTGENGGEMRDICDICIRVPSNETNHIQEMHIAVGHIICGLIEDFYC